MKTSFEVGDQGFELSLGYLSGDNDCLGLSDLDEGFKSPSFDGGLVESFNALESLLDSLELDVSPLGPVELGLEVRRHDLAVLPSDVFEGLEGEGLVEVVNGDISLFVVSEIIVLHGNLNLGVKDYLPVHGLLSFACMGGVFVSDKTEASTFEGNKVTHDFDRLDGSVDRKFIEENVLTDVLVQSPDE